MNYITPSINPKFTHQDVYDAYDEAGIDSENVEEILASIETVITADLSEKPGVVIGYGTDQDGNVYKDYKLYIKAVFEREGERWVSDGTFAFNVDAMMRLSRAAASRSL